MINFFIKNKVAIFITAAVMCLMLSFTAGWKVHSYYVGYQQNIENTVKKEVQRGIDDMQRQNAQSLIDTQKKLDNLKSKTIIEKVPQIIDRPIYLQSCIDEDGVKILKQYKEESNKIRQERRQK